MSDATVAFVGLARLQRQYRRISAIDMTEAHYVDASIAESMTCTCGSPCRYHGEQSSGSYVALAVCKQCGKEREF